MSKHHDDSDLLTLELLKKYRDGTLSPDEEVRLETLRTQDAFVADALDGVSITSDGEAFVADVESLRDSLRERVRQPERLSRYSLRIAASVALLLTFSCLIYLYVFNTGLLPVAHEPNSPESTTTEQSSVSSLRTPSLLSLPPTALADTPRLSPPVSESLALVQTPSVKEETSFVADRPATSSPQAETEISDQASTLAKPQSRTEAQENTSALKLAKHSRAATFPISTVTGQVTDQDTGDPLPGVNVSVKGTQQGVVTDVSGNYQVNIDSAQKTLAFNSVGYATKEAQAIPGQAVDVALEADVQSLSEVVVISSNQNESGTTSARPLSGMRAFKKYLRTNAQQPEGDSNYEKGLVKVSFYVQPSGELTNFTIAKSAGTWFDREAIRIIQEGPRWQPATQDGQRVEQQVTVRVRFN